MDTRKNTDRILYLVKTKGPQTAKVLADQLGVTTMAVRQHLQTLQADNLITYEDRRANVGRPARYWLLTDESGKRFPDSHAELTLNLLRSAHEVFGEAGVDKLIEQQAQDTLQRYQSELNGCEDLEARLAKISELRTREGYMAEWRETEDGNFMLLENHCPVCAAATSCQGLCRSELSLFQTLLDSMAEVERTEHILAGARRCAYLITPIEA
ncbi:MAG: metalloregulator ArsR/SmtB family transcription factor [Pseudomonadota bacterium]